VNREGQAGTRGCPRPAVTLAPGGEREATDHRRARLTEGGGGGCWGRREGKEGARVGQLFGIFLYLIYHDFAKIYGPAQI
jgi:hypothetical protein